MLLLRRGVHWMLGILCTMFLLLMLMEWPGALKDWDQPFNLTHFYKKMNHIEPDHHLERKEEVTTHLALRTLVPTTKALEFERHLVSNDKGRTIWNIRPPNPNGEPNPDEEITLSTDYSNTIYNLPEFVTHLSAGRSDVSIVLGIPTSKRKREVLTETIKKILDGMTSKEKADTLIVVLLVDTDKEYVVQVIGRLKKLFKMQINSGLLEVISPPKEYYENMQALVTSTREPEEGGKLNWARNNLDFGYIAMHAESKGKFYVHLGDNIEARAGFISRMKKYAIEKIDNPWFVLDFGNSDFIGKMFRCIELSSLYHFFIAYHDRKPPEELLDDFLNFNICTVALKQYKCLERKTEAYLHVKPPLFKHVSVSHS